MKKFLLMTLLFPIMTFAQVGEEQENPDRRLDMDDISYELKEGGRALSKYHKQANTAQTLQLSGIGLSALGYLVSDARTSLLFLGVGGAVNIAGLITFISADKHIDRAGRHLHKTGREFER